MKNWKVIAVNVFLGLVIVGVFGGFIPLSLTFLMIGILLVVTSIIGMFEGSGELKIGRTGEFIDERANVHKKKNPILFWFLVIGQLVWAVFFFFLATYIYFEK